jgi:undecaprenyl-diphosphatase
MKILKKDLFCFSLFAFLFTISLLFLDKWKIPKTKALDIFFYLFKEAYSYVFLIVLVLLAFSYMNRRYKSKLKKEILSILLTIIFVFLLKILIARERPEEGFYIGKSFPSNHSATLASLLPFSKNVFFVFWLFVCFYVGLSRAYWQYHYFSDIFGGMLIGFLIGFFVKSLKFKMLR